MTWGTNEEKYTKVCMDLLVARYMYYVVHRPMMPDAEYDAKEAKLRVVEASMPHLKHPDSPTQKPGSDSRDDYPRSVRWHCEFNLMGRAVDHEGYPSWATSRAVVTEVELRGAARSQRIPADPNA